MDPFKTVTDKLGDLAMFPVEWTLDKIKGGIANFAAEYIAVVPVLAGVSVGAYALLNMFSHRLATLAVKGIFVYGALLVIVL